MAHWCLFIIRAVTNSSTLNCQLQATMYNKIVKQCGTKLSSAEVQSLLVKHLPGWIARDDCLHREYTLNNFEQTWAFLNQVAMRSHLWGHHPTITTTYNKVKVELTTHDLQGISDIDVKLARKIEGYREQYFIKS